MDPLVFGSQFVPNDDQYLLSNSSTHDVFPIQTWMLTCYSLISFAGLIGNSLVLYVVASNLPMRQSSFGTYLGGLALADLLVAVLCLPVYITSTSSYKDHPTGTGGDVMCKILSGYNILFFFATVSVYTLVAISLERYYAICNPLSSRAVASPGRAMKILAGVWIFSLVLGILSIYGEQYADQSEASVGAHCKFSVGYTDHITPKVVYVLIFSVQFVLPVCCMVFCFIRIRSVLLKQIHDLQAKDVALQVAEMRQIKQRRNTIVTVIIVVLAYFALWSPNQVLYFCFNFQFFEMSWDSNMVQASVVLCFFTCCVNPVIYAFRSKQFRIGFMAVFKCHACVQLHTRLRGYSTFASGSVTNSSSDRRL